MGTNFYLHSPACSECGHAEEVRHIGKRSDGWAFLLHVRFPDELFRHETAEVPKDLAGWVELFKRDGYTILDDGGVHWTPAAMMVAIHEGGKRRGNTCAVPTYQTDESVPYDYGYGLFQ